MISNAVKNSLRSKNKERARILRKAKRGASIPWPIERIQALGPISLEVFCENISRIWPIVLELSANGTTALEIERILNLDFRVLKMFFTRFPQLKEQFDNAKATRLDDSAQ